MSEPFYLKDKYNKDGYESKCKVCKRKDFKPTGELIDVEVEKIIQEYEKMFPDCIFKFCKVCKINFPISDTFFKKEIRQKDGLENKCRICKGGIFRELNMINTDIIYSEDNIINDYERCLLTNRMPSKQFINDNYIRIIKYLIEEKYKMNENDILLISRFWIKDNKLYGVLTKKFSGSIVDLINMVYPNRFYPWQFTNSGSNYWNNEDNKKLALNWFIDQLYKDKVINSDTDIPSIMCVELFARYGLGGLLTINFGHTFYAIDSIMSDRFFEWEYNVITHDLWTAKENRIKAFKQLIEQRMKISIKDIPKIISFMYLYDHPKYNRFISPLTDYYNSNVYQYVNDCYPNTFKEYEFSSQNHCQTLDGTTVKSEPERAIQHAFMNSNIDYEYEPKDKWFSNKVENESYRPDWIVQHKGKIIIVEYYGMLNSVNFDIGYDEKYIRKSKYYNELCKNDNRYTYIELMVNDIKNGLIGMVNKFRDIRIDIKPLIY